LWLAVCVCLCFVTKKNSNNQQKQQNNQLCVVVVVVIIMASLDNSSGAAFRAVKVGNFVLLTATSHASGLSCCVSSTTSSAITATTSPGSVVELSPVKSLAALFEVVRGVMPGTIKLRNVQEDKFLGTTQHKQIVWLTNLDQWSDIIVVCESNGIFLTFAANAISLAFGDNGGVVPPEKIGSSRPTCFGARATTKEEIVSGDDSTPSDDTTAFAVTTGSMVLRMSQSDSTPAVSKGACLPAQLGNLKSSTKEAIVALHTACMGIKRPVTLIVKNDLPNTTITLFSFSLTDGKISKHSANPLNLTCVTGQALFWQCVQKRLIGASGTASFHITHPEHRQLRTTFTVNWNHPVGKKHSSY